MNKKATAFGAMTQYIPYYIMMILILLGIILAAASFFGQGYDTRNEEATQLYQKVKDCLTKTEMKIENFNLTKCQINPEVIKKEHIILLKKDNQEYYVGVYDYKNQCALTAARKNKAIPICKNGTIQKNNEEIQIIVGTSQKIRSVAA